MRLARPNSRFSKFLLLSTETCQDYVLTYLLSQYTAARQAVVSDAGRCGAERPWGWPDRPGRVGPRGLPLTASFREYVRTNVCARAAVCIGAASFQPHTKEACSLEGHRDEVLLATKAGRFGFRELDFSPARIRASLEEALSE